jgi:two-component system response regulator AtoC
MQGGASDYILKSVSAETLNLAVKKAVNGSNGGPRHTEHGQAVARPGHVITQSPKMMQVLKIAKKVAKSNATVLIQGESGTGKEVLAAFIHFHSLLKTKALRGGKLRLTP